MDKDFFLVVVLVGLLLWFLHAVVVPMVPAPFQMAARIALGIIAVLVIAVVVFFLFAYFWARL